MFFFYTMQNLDLACPISANGAPGSYAKSSTCSYFLHFYLGQTNLINNLIFYDFLLWNQHGTCPARLFIWKL